MRVLCRASVARQVSRLARHARAEHRADRDDAVAQRYRNRLWIDMPSGDSVRRVTCRSIPGCSVPCSATAILWTLAVRFSTAADSMRQRLGERIDAALDFVYAGGVDWRIVQRQRVHRSGFVGVTPNPLTPAIKSLGLWGLCSHGYSFRAAFSTRRASSVSICCADCSIRTAGSNAGERFASRHRAAARRRCRRARALAGRLVQCRMRSNPYFSHRGERAKAASASCARSIIRIRSRCCCCPKSRRAHCRAGRRKRPTFATIEPSRVCPDAMHCGYASISLCT